MILGLTTSLPAQSLSQGKPTPVERQQRESTNPTEAAPTPAPAYTDPWMKWFQGDSLLDDWSGARSQLVKEGVTFFGSYEADMAASVQGGRSLGQAYADNLDYGMRFDMQKLVGWNGAKIVISGIDRNGQNLSATHIGNFYPVQQVYGGQTIFLYALYLDQSFMHDQLSWKIGRFAMTDDFVTSPIFGLYMNNGIDGNPKSLFATDAFSSYPGTVWGTRLRYDPSKEVNVKLGVYQADNRIYEPNKHGVDFGIRGYDGVTVAGQVEWDPVWFQKPDTDSSSEAIADKGGKPKIDGLAGHYWFGSYFSTLAVAEYNNSTNGSGPTLIPSNSSDVYGFYWHTDQMVYQAEPGTEKGLTLWADFILEPEENTILIPYHIEGGLFYRGLIPTRGDDSIIFGAIDGIFSKNQALTYETLGVANAGSEKIFEFSYRAQLTKFTYVQPTAQWIINPSGTAEIPNAVVLGLRLGITF